ncbi:TIGR03086 family metal-binding protein [Paractinoplanes globisporus]|uniref:TIGR03086 family metal-binding protein n=1 Tax=Paractinoplanes globisporus TaxID=113565 RepID=A0ABW6W569_9ACTN|nr:TIGR03086 family metal-binding protein [Actinoplanes globisporus]
MDVVLRAGVAVLERAVAYCLGSVTLVTQPMLAWPTPCARWDLRDLLEHVIDSMAALEEAAASGEVALTPPADAGDVVPGVRLGAARLLGAWTNACGAPFVRVEHATLSTPLVAGAGAIELAVHGWDVARSCGADRPIPDDLADELLDLALVLIRAADRPGRFDRPVSIAGHAPPGERLLGFLGRDAGPRPGG